MPKKTNLKLRSAHVRLALALALAASNAACTTVHERARPTAELRPESPSHRALEILRPGDAIEVSYVRTPELNALATLDIAGSIQLPMVGPIVAAGSTPRELKGLIERRAGEQLREPNVTVSVVGTEGRAVHVGGEVATPGRYGVSQATNPVEALFVAGGALDSGYLDGIVLVRPEITGEVRSYLLDINGTLRGESEDGWIQLHPSDVLFVPRTPVANVNVWIDRYITRNLPFGVALRPDLGNF